MTVFTLAYAVMRGLWRSATEKSGCAPILFIHLILRQNISPQKDAIQREQSQACLSYAEREHLRPKVKNIRLSQYVKDRFSEWRVELARTLPSAQDLRGESLRDRFSGRSDGFEIRLR